MKKSIISLVVILALILPSFAFAGGGFSGGSVRSSGSFGGSFHSSSFSGTSFHSSGSVGGGSYRSSGGFSNPVKSVGSFFGSGSKASPASSIPRTTYIYHDTYSYNPLSGNFWFWMWVFGRHNSNPTVINNITASTTATTK